MAKRTTKTTAPPEPTHLTKSKGQFKAELQERIVEGEELLKRNIQILRWTYLMSRLWNLITETKMYHSSGS